MDTYYVEIDDQGASCYGGVETIELLPDRVRVRFSGSAAKSLGHSKLEVSFRISQSELSSLRSQLASVFHGTACFRDNS